jgi:hypothetical protein
LNYAPRLGEIVAPTLIVCGHHHPQFAPACSEELARGIRNAQLTPVAGDFHARQIDVFSGALLILLITTVTIRWIRGNGTLTLMLIGVAWVIVG